MKENRINYSIHYENWHNTTSIHAEEMANNLVPILEPHLPSNINAKILDIGCGYGFAMKALQRLGFQKILGLEISVEQAEIAKGFGFDVIVVNDTIEHLKKCEMKFDFIILFDVLEHIQVNLQIEFLKSIYDVLNPEGKLILTTPNANSILSCRWRYIDYTHFSSFTEHSLNFVLRNAGFQNIWIDNKKGIGNFPKGILKKGYKQRLRKWIVRFFWRQVFLAEIPMENHDKISFELNLTAVTQK